MIVAETEVRLIGLTVENFRCYTSPISIRFDDLTAIVGMNDVGKSTLMDALAIFFESINPDKDDISKFGETKPIRICCEFDTLPSQIVIDTDFPSSLSEEYLLSKVGTLKIRKTYNATPRLMNTEAIALHPEAKGFNDLLSLKKTDLLKRAADLSVNLDHVDKRANAPVRKAIWESCDDLQLSEIPISLDGEGGKQVWSALSKFIPRFALFKSDRASTDQDPEAQDPLNAAIKEAIQGIEEKLIQITTYVEAEVQKNCCSDG